MICCTPFVWVLRLVLCAGTFATLHVLLATKHTHAASRTEEAGIGRAWQGVSRCASSSFGYQTYSKLAAIAMIWHRSRSDKWKKGSCGPRGRMKTSRPSLYKPGGIHMRIEKGCVVQHNAVMLAGQQDHGQLPRFGIFAHCFPTFCDPRSFFRSAPSSAHVENTRHLTAHFPTEEVHMLNNSPYRTPHTPLHLSPTSR